MTNEKCPKCTKRITRKESQESIPLLVDNPTTSEKYRILECLICSYREVYKIGERNVSKQER